MTDVTKMREANVPDEFTEWLNKCPEKFTPMRTSATYGKGHYESLTYTFTFDVPDVTLVVFDHQDERKATWEVQ